MIQHERYLPKEDWLKLRPGDRIKVELSSGTVIEGDIKDRVDTYGFSVGGYFVQINLIKAIKMVKANNPLDEELERLGEVGYKAWQPHASMAAPWDTLRENTRASWRRVAYEVREAMLAKKEVRDERRLS